jgi:hypothetical protein
VTSKQTGWILAICGLIANLSLALLLVSMHHDTSHHPTPIITPPAGVCVLTSPDIADTSLIATVTPGHIHNGIITCDAGVWVPTTPVAN